MSLFDFIFGLNAVILGLALAEMASRFQQLVFAGRRVKWAIEPVILAFLIFFVILVVWLSSWKARDIHQISIGEVALNLVAIIGPYMVAAAVFPRAPEQGQIDLHAYYDRSRLFLFGTLLVGQVLNWSVNAGHVAAKIHDTGALVHGLVFGFPYYDTIPYSLLMFVRWRWFNIAALLFVGAMFVPGVIGYPLTG
jgi:hypothetical protein